MDYSEIDQCIKDIKSRYSAGEGFAEFAGGPYRPDATALAILTLSAAGTDKDFIEPARLILVNHQLHDGRVSLPGRPEAFWPSYLAIFAWQGSISFKPAQNRALKFLVKTSGNHFKKIAGSPVAHDTSLRGWPWIEDTHAFVEPTALALLALEMSGQAKLQRFEEGVRVLMDRQLPHGGWNYGNTFVYGRELHPFTDTTGAALSALAGHAAKKDVGLSIKFLKDRVEHCRTPLSLAWALFGLGAWGEFPDKGSGWIEESLKRQERYGAYRTTLLSLLALCYLCQGDFRKSAM